MTASFHLSPPGHPGRPRFAGGLAILALAAGGPLGAQVTESPQTIAPGRFLLRMDALSLSFDRHRPEDDGTRFTTVAVGRAFLSTGLTPQLDAQMGAELFVQARTKRSGSTQAHSGTGDLYFRTKWSFWRDQSLGAAAALIPYIKVPTSTGGVGNGSTEGGLIVPWALSLGGGFEAGAMAEWDVLRNDANNGYDSQWYASGVFSRALTQSVTVYGESTLTATSASSSRTALTMGGGVTVKLTPNFRVDYALNAGLSRGAADWNPVLRINWEF
ncbi:MAG: transporter [Opitutaceae bacterium]|nr:transporter [Opitutaceae bacterium]